MLESTIESSIFAEEQEMNLSLQEALRCTTCTTTHLPRTSLHTDLRTGVYNPTRDPPFSHYPRLEQGISSTTPLATSDDNESISPRTIPTSHLKPGYQALMSPAQQRLYQKLIERLLRWDSKKDALFARYRVDYHIHLHYLARRGVLTLCRDMDEVVGLREWRWKMAVLEEEEVEGEDGGGGVDHRKERGKQDVVSVQAKKERRGGWPQDENLSMMYQMALWRRKGSARQQRVAEARIKWAAIVDERRSQRAAKVKVRLSVSRKEPKN